MNKRTIDKPCIVLVGEHIKGVKVLAESDTKRFIYLDAPFELIVQPEKLETDSKTIINFNWDTKPEVFKQSLRECLNRGYIILTRILNLPNDYYDVELDDLLKNMKDINLVILSDDDYPDNTFIENIIEVDIPKVCQLIGNV